MTATHAPGSINPADLKPLSPVTPSTPAEVREVAQKARAAQGAWAALPLDARSAAAYAFGQKLLEKADAAADLLSMETGRSALECKMSELVSVAEYVKAAVRVAKQALKPEKVKLSALDYPGKRAVIEPVARGVIGIIAPWNYPMGNFFKSLFPALLSGNAVVLKPSEFTPRSGAFLAQLAAEVFPKDLVGLVQGAGEVGAAVIDNVDAVVFTGSVPTGRKVAMRAAERLIPCSVELGGKDAALVLADCDLDRTAVGVAQWAIHNCGQNCAAIERVYVEEAIADRFVETLTRVVKKLRVAPGAGPTDLGPLQSEAQLAIVEKHVEEAKAKGAVVTCGGARTGQGLGYQPTVLDKCAGDMQVVRDETFGPVIAVLRVKDAEEGLKRANDSRYGLNGSVWTKDLARGEALARRMEVGVAYVNNHAFGGILAQVPWTGVKETGPGIAASGYSYGTFVRRRTVLVDGSKNPDPWWFPLNEDIAAFSAALIERGRGGGLGVLLKLGGLVKKRTQAIRELTK
ncbi:MAG: aldehyde dehydrogenase family protein [Myxococcales bacterium]|nr:aldehyde dehydrogenase family protein [Myxococcales bacterium]